MCAWPHIFSNPSFSITLLLCVSCQQGTDERSKVSPVEETAFCRSHARTSLHAPIHENQGGGEAQLAAITGAVQVRTHLRPAELMRAALSDLLPLCVPLNHHQHSVNSQILLTLLHQVLRKKKKPHLADLTAVSYFCYQLTLKYHAPTASEAQAY